MALVDPPMHISTRSAFSTDLAVITCDGVMRVVSRRTAAVPVCSAATSRWAFTAGMAAVPGSDMPSVSAMHAIVLAVPITAQVPAVTDSCASIASICWSLIVPARYLPQKLRQSVQAPRRWP